MKYTLFLFLLFFLCIGCRQTFFNEYKNVTAENCTKIIIENADTTTANIIINKTENIHSFIAAINEAKKTSLWKGTAWGKMKFVYPDTIIELSTLIKVFKSPVTGDFYEINDKLIHYFK